MQAKIEKATDKLKNSGAQFQYLIDRMDRWLLKNARTLVEYFRQFDQEGEGFLSYEEFKSGILVKSKLNKTLKSEYTNDNLKL